MYRGGVGDPLVVLHGGCATWRLWEPALRLLERNFEVLAMTLPGHWGGPPLPRDGTVSIGTLADAVEREMHVAGWKTAYIAGGSLGGWVSLELARRRRAHAVIAIAPACGWTPGGPFFFALASGYWLMMRLAPPMAKHAEWWTARPRLRRLLTWHHFRRPEGLSGELAAHLLRAIAGADPDGAAQFLAATRRYDVERDLRGISCPILLAYPEQDFVLPRRFCARRLKAAIPEADVITLPGVGHAAMVDNPSLVADTIAAFTRRHASETR